jgi:hypothetical protein
MPTALSQLQAVYIYLTEKTSVCDETTGHPTNVLVEDKIPSFRGEE